MVDPASSVEARTRAWLESSYLDALHHLADSHEPVWGDGGQPHRLTRYHFQEVQRKLKIFRWLDRLRFETFLDVGSGFDVYPNLVRARYGARTMFSDFAHTMNMPFGGAASGKLDSAVTLNAARLPFPDGAFDVVLASEVLEHLVRPIDVIAELVRVSRTAVIMTSLEALATTAWERRRAHWRIDVRRPHVERNFFLLEELEAVFGPEWRHENLLFDPALPVSGFRPEPVQAERYAALREAESVVDALCAATAVSDHRRGAMGILLVKPLPGAPAIAPPPHEPDRELVRWLLAEAAAHERRTLALARALKAGTVELPELDRPVSAALAARLCCPDCRAAVAPTASGLRCHGCGTEFAAEYGVPIMYPTRPLDTLVSPDQILDRLCGGDPARRRTVRRVMRRLRRNERPPGVMRRMSWRFFPTG